MAVEHITVMNTLNGQIAVVDKVLLDNPIFAEYQVEVEPGSKPIALMKPCTAEEFKARRKGRTKSSGKTPKPSLTTEGISDQTEEG